LVYAADSIENAAGGEKAVCTLLLLAAAELENLAPGCVHRQRLRRLAGEADSY
jgi:hypothetical protein